MKAVLVSILVTFLLCSCQSNVHNDTDQSYNVYAFYALDDKTAMDNDAVNIMSWLQKKSESLEKGKVTYDLFDENRNGGGPNGAEWNPEADMYVATNVAFQESLNIRINDTVFDQVVYEANGYKWFLLEQNYWVNAFQEIKADDIKNLYTQDYIIKNQSGAINTVGELDLGVFFEILIYVDGKEWRKEYFHAIHAE